MWMDEQELKPRGKREGGGGENEGGGRQARRMRTQRAERFEKKKPRRDGSFCEALRLS